MFGKSRYFGLKGTRLNVAIGVLAGLDFLYVKATSTATVKVDC